MRLLCLLSPALYHGGADRQFVSAAPNEALTPGRSRAAAKLPEGFSVRAVATGLDDAGQPVGMSFDARGRRWVLQYLRYTALRGLKAVTQRSVLVPFTTR